MRQRRVLCYLSEFDSSLDELRLQTSREREMEEKIQQLENNAEHLKRRMLDLQRAKKSAVSGEFQYVRSNCPPDECNMSAVFAVFLLNVRTCL